MLTAVGYSGGATWLRVVQTTEANLGREMAGCGWDFDEEGDEEGEGEDGHFDANGVLPLCVASDLVSAARLNRHNHIHPSIKLVLTRIKEGTNPHIDKLLRRIRRMGGDDVTITVECANSAFNTAPVPSIQAALSTMLEQPTVSVTETVNVDTSAIIMLVSDITHRRIEIETWHSRNHVAEIKHENTHPGEALQEICGIIAGKRLVCTQEAAEMAQKLLKWMGQESEKTRAALLLDMLPDTSPAQQTPQARLQGLQALSDHPITGLQLPIHVIEEPWDRDRIATAIKEGELPHVATKVSSRIRKPTVSIFMYGWAAGYTTLTTNFSCSRQVARLTEQHRTDKDEKGPACYVLATARSLNSTKKEASFKGAGIARKCTAMRF